MTTQEFDFMAPLPAMALPVNRSWEPAARHYIDLTDNEKVEQGVMHNVMHISEVLAETFKVAPTPENLTAWVDSQPMVGQGLLFCDEVNSEFVKGFTLPNVTNEQIVKGRLSADDDSQQRYATVEY